MTTKDKIARRKLSLLELAGEMNNVSKACRIMGYSRQQFYEIRRNYQTYGADGLIDRPPAGAPAAVLPRSPHFMPKAAHALPPVRIKMFANLPIAHLTKKKKPSKTQCFQGLSVVAGALFVRTHTLSLLAPNRSILCAGFGVKAEIPACMGVCGRIVAVADERLRWRSRG